MYYIERPRVADKKSLRMNMAQKVIIYVRVLSHPVFLVYFYLPV